MPPWLEWALGLIGGFALFVLVMPWLVRPFWFLVTAPRYGLTVLGAEHVPKAGPVLIVVNHVTWIDGFLLARGCPRRARFLIYALYVDLPIIRLLARRGGLIPVPATGPKAQRAAIDAARKALDRGEVVCIFPEGQLTRNGLTGPFKRGMELILHGREGVPVVPAYLDRLWGSVFSAAGGGFFSSRPTGLRHRVTLAFGPPLPPPVTAFAARQAVLATGAAAFALRPEAGRWAARLPDPVDPDLPGWVHPALGPLTGSAADIHRDDLRQIGGKPGTVGSALPGVALRAVGADGAPLPPDSPGRIEALVDPAGWNDTGRTGRIDADGFVTLDDPAGGVGS